MDRERSSLYIGLIVLVSGIVVLMAVLASVIGLASNPGSFLQRQAGGQAGAPKPFFSWASNDLTATFMDLSSSGSAAIATRTWDFGDGATSTERDPVHDYATNGTFLVRLTVRDANGLEAVSAGEVNVEPSRTHNGTAQGNPGLDLNLGGLFLLIGVAALTFGMYLIGFLVGGSLVKAGWNLIRPRPETIRIRLRPQNYESMATAEVVAPPVPQPPMPVASPPIVEGPPPPPAG